MAQRGYVMPSDLDCSVCKKTFRDPVTLGCSHSFCSKCLKQCWERADNKNCPVCQRKSSKEHVGVNFKLKALADSSAERQREKKLELVCREHGKEHKWFCEDEQRAYCDECEPSLHKSKKVVPVDQAVKDLRSEMESQKKNLQDKTDKLKQAAKNYEGMVEHAKNQAVSTQRQIKAEFKKLRESLEEEEEGKLSALREEEERKTKTIYEEKKKIDERLSAVLDTISAIEEELNKEDNMAFLSSYKDTQSRARDHSSESDPQPISGALIDVAKYLDDLPYTRSKNKKKKKKEEEEDKVLTCPFILDPNTAHPWLYLSDDLTSVRNGDTWQQLPDNPERFTNHATVLGSEGFSSGKHTWEVEVGDHPLWDIGVAKESVDRKGDISGSVKENGIWCLSYWFGTYYDVVGERISVNKSPQRIRVQLDFDRGEVSFYDSEDQSLLCSHTDTFTEKLFPYFYIGWAFNAAEIKICQSEVSE